MTSPIDILGVGCVAVDDLLYVAEYPPADSKAQVEHRERHCGGLTATALVAAARLGARCSFAATLGDDELSRFVLERFRQEGIDLGWMHFAPGAQPIHSVIVVDQRTKTRTIFADPRAFEAAQGDGPEESAVRSARVLFVDHVVAARAVRAAGIARAAGIPVVADLESDRSPHFRDLLALVDHLIVSRDFAGKLTGCGDPAAAAERLWSPQRQAVVVTGGAEGCWYVGSGHERQVSHQPAFRVDVVDTTGCGDVFHGAYAAGLVEGLDLPDRVRLAAAAAALKATRSGGQAGIPARRAVEQFLEENTL